jgi:hypothetical protein
MNDIEGRTGECDEREGTWEKVIGRGLWVERIIGDLGRGGGVHFRVYVGKAAIQAAVSRYAYFAQLLGKKLKEIASRKCFEELLMKGNESLSYSFENCVFGCFV